MNPRIPFFHKEECKIECGDQCSHLCEVFFSCAGGGDGDMVADFETQKLRCVLYDVDNLQGVSSHDDNFRELTQSLSAVISVLESKPLRISTGQKHILDCMNCFSFKFLTNDVYENDTIQDVFVNITKVEQTHLPDEDIDNLEV